MYCLLWGPADYITWLH